MVIIIEGIDRVGKTTLANRISNEINGQVFKASRVEIPYARLDENNALSYGYCMGQAQLLNDTYSNYKDKHIILDRFHWTEYVYTKAQRDRELDKYYVNKVEAEMLKNKPGYLIIFMLPIDIKRCSRLHGKDLSEHQKLFDELYDNCSLLKYKCTYMTDNLAVDNVKKFIKGKFKKQGEGV